MTAPCKVEEVLVVGLGLIGGSVALAIRERGLASRITAVDLPRVVQDPRAGRAADTLLASDDLPAVRAAYDRAELVVVATPVSAILEFLPHLLSGNATVTDCGSTKREIAKLARDHGQFVPGHPMTGFPAGGLDNARGDLFHGQSWILCPEHSDVERVEEVRSFVTSLGAHAVSMSAADHDRAVAICSHLPRLVASAVVAMAAENDTSRATGPAFESLARAAGGAETIWGDIFRSNADELAAAARELATRLAGIATDLEKPAPDIRSALELLRNARSARGR